MTADSQSASLYWQPRRDTAREALNQFLPHAGGHYARQRNFDRGPQDREHVSRLSPWVRVRAISEPEIIRAVCSRHSPEAADKFIQEVCWRTYWKGWLEMRPSIWTDYMQAVRVAKTQWKDRSEYAEAIQGQTQSPTFNTFLHELLDNGYLHNHARMWFASIWIFTLRLPWELGADLFLRHLLDGDAAVNTLSWRWVAGLQTRGKQYVARPDNIIKYTEGRLGEGEVLAASPQPVMPLELPEPEPLPVFPECPVDERGGVIITEDDVSASEWLNQTHAVAGIFPLRAYQEAGIAKSVIEFRQSLLQEAVAPEVVWNESDSLADAVSEWVNRHALNYIVIAEPPVGLGQSVIEQLSVICDALSIPLYRQRHRWDEALFPYATHGFFRFRKKLPKIIRHWL